MTASRGAVLALVAVLAAPALAAEPPAKPAAPAPAASAPAPRHAGGDVAVGREVARLLVTKETWSRGVDQIATDARNRVSMHPGAALKFPPDMQAKARAEVEKALPYEDLIEMHAKELAANYTTPQLNELLAFFRTPTGKHWLEVQPSLYESVGMQTQNRMAEKMPAIMKSLAQLSTSKPKGEGAEKGHGAKKADAAKKPEAAKGK
jgi:hypothetical protein